MIKLLKKLNKKGKILLGVLLILIIVILVLVGIALKNRASSASPKGMTEDYLKSYQTLEKSVVSNITYDFSDKLTSEQETRYKEVLKNQYENMTYNIKEEYVGEVDSIITVEVSVRDLKSAYDKAKTYIDNFPDKFKDEKEQVNYILDELEDCNERVEYEIKFNYYKDSYNKWVLTDLSDSDLQKLDGTF